MFFIEDNYVSESKAIEYLLLQVVAGWHLIEAI